MTNRHVAELFSYGLGQSDVTLKPGSTVVMDLKAEHGNAQRVPLAVEGVRMIHPFWDMALLEVDGLPPQATILELSQESPADLRGRDFPGRSRPLGKNTPLRS